MLSLKQIKAVLFLAFAMFFCATEILANNSPSSVKKIEFTQDNQLEITLSKKTDFKIFTLKNPNRLVIDIMDSKLENKNYQPKLSSLTSSFRSKKDPNYLRLVFDLNKPINIVSSRFEKIKNNSNKIIVEVSQEKSKDFIASKAEEFDVKTTKVNNSDGTSKYVVTKITKNQPSFTGYKKIPTIVIDAGHGGKDPGTIGNFARTKEKNITLSYAKELAKQLMNTGRYRVYLTRNNDYFISLRQRVERARKIKADIFISLHANSAADSSVSGFSLYTLSENSSDKQAELLAQKENRSDIIAGIDFSNASYDIMKTLIDLSQRESKNSSANFAAITVKLIKKSDIKILQNSHRFAGFAVLTAPDMASILLELGYLSNKNEEKLLNNIFYKRQVAKILVEAIDEYFSKNKL